MNYTFSERTVKKYTVGQAVTAAETRLAGKTRGICMNAVNRRDLTEKITLKELNELADAIVDDSFYHN